MHGYWLGTELRCHRDCLVTLPELDPVWSRTVVAPDHRGELVEWHLLDSHATRSDDNVDFTMLCVHGNPTWSYMWRNVISQAPANIRVIAVDQLEMGWSARTGRSRRLANRIEDLSRLTSELGIAGDVIVAAHDWGGPIALGWALEHIAQVRAVVLLNTAVHQPENRSFPALIAAARRTGSMATQRTPLFIRGTTALSRGRMRPDVARAFHAPYATAIRRQGVHDFVSDIPVDQSDASWSTLHGIATSLDALASIPTLLVWGSGDPVFSDRYLHDLQERLPHADVQRYARARHLVLEDEPDAVACIWRWCAEVLHEPEHDRPSLESSARLWEPVADRAAQHPLGTALTWVTKGRLRQITWSQLHDRIEALATGFHRAGIGPGDRVSVLIQPSADLIAVVYALWRIGASAVITDSGLGVQGMRQALRSAAPDHVIGIPRGLMLARSIHIPGVRINARNLIKYATVTTDLPVPEPYAEAVVVFTSGATGPAKGVRYTQVQVQGTRDVIQSTYGISTDDALVAAFAPWAVLGPTLGIPSAIPDMDVTSPRTLTAQAVAAATKSIHGTIMWASPAALRNVIATADGLPDTRTLASLRLVMAAGAPVSVAMLTSLAKLLPNARIGTPYGMTEVLPVCDVSLDELVEAGHGNGVLVGTPVAGVELAIRALSSDGVPVGDLRTTANVTGEIHVRAPHMRAGYDRLAAVDLRSPGGWHATGDVGHLDELGRLWIEGRLVHVVVTERGYVTPVGLEQCLQREVDECAVVGVGPRGGQQLVAVITGDGGPLADVDLTMRLRHLAQQWCEHDLVAVLVREKLPTDIRHNAKIDRQLLSNWADQVLAG